jgi:hypothetical protein
MTDAQIIQLMSYVIVFMFGICIGVFSTLTLTNKNTRIDHHHDHKNR